jgi:hypothetical protein
VEIGDLEGARFRGRISARLRRRNLVQAASFPGGPVSAQDLLRAYRAYAGSADPCTLAGEIRRISRGLVEERLRALEERLAEERGAREPEPVRPEA